ncbi:hypothetical protein QR680_003377 [Steinernema hermaphroditum]|uniref:Peptidase S1 domain-containing protein n=1 Tax=Steinernema hermaphroditum TaxID=289476 RepID=A0AA39H6H5_9BILA|nr:hypothetical protein QR680_003377 [Steinernema hermaphroditum]
MLGISRSTLCDWHTMKANRKLLVCLLLIFFDSARTNNNLEVFNGDEARIGEFPFFVLFQIKRNDIAILGVTVPFAFTSYVKNISILKDDSKIMIPKNTVKAIGSGDVGRGIPSDILRKANMEISEQSKCRKIYLCSALRQFCCEDPEKKSASKGDSGAPLLVSVRHQGKKIWAALGMTLSGLERSEHEDQEPSLFLRLSPYCNYIKREIGEDFDCI